jgi:hypothetical protein
MKRSIVLSLPLLLVFPGVVFFEWDISFNLKLGSFTQEIAWLSIEICG